MEDAKAARDLGYPKSMMQMDEVRGLDMSIQQAVEAKRLDKPLTQEQKKDMLKWAEQFRR
jgi:hypothetical protein